MSFATLKDIDVQNKTVIVRCDLNVPTDNGKVSDYTRIARLKPTIDYLIESNAKIVLISHFGRPKGQVNEKFSLKFLPPFLKENWGIDVTFADQCIGDTVKNKVASLKTGEIILLENLRFHGEEEANDKAFAAQLAALGDVYINDAFSAAHRAHASIAAISEFLPSVAGKLMEEELSALERILSAPDKPIGAVVGGAKISTKLSLLSSLVRKVDYLILGGGMANTFLLARGFEVGNSLCEPDMLDETKQIMVTAQQHECDIILPIDANCADEFAENAQSMIMPTATIPNHLMVLDVGPESIINVKEILATCKTVLWNGPMGAFEIKPFDKGTNELASAVAAHTRDGILKSVAGGGDTVAALECSDSAKDFTYISTAGGAFLEWVEGKTLPGIAALEKNVKAA